MAKKKIKRRKGRADAEAKKKAFAKELRIKQLAKRGITPDYCKAAIAELDRLIEKTIELGLGETEALC